MQNRAKNPVPEKRKLRKEQKAVRRTYSLPSTHDEWLRKQAKRSPHGKMSRVLQDMIEERMQTEAAASRG